MWMCEYKDTKANFYFSITSNELLTSLFMNKTRTESGVFRYVQILEYSWGFFFVFVCLF